MSAENKETQGKTGIRQNIPEFYDEHGIPLKYKQLEEMRKALPNTKEGRAFAQKIKMQQKYLHKGRHHGESNPHTGAVFHV